MEIWQRTAQFFLNWGLCQRGFNWLWVPMWVSAPQTHSRVTHINFNILIFLLGGDSLNIPWKIGHGRQSSFSIGVYVKGIALAFNWLKWLGGFQHIKPTVGWQISTLIFWFFWGDPINIPRKFGNGRQSSFSIGVYVKGITREFNWLKWLGGFQHIKPTVGWQIWTLIFWFLIGGTL
jgi:hypothetical protein